MADQKKILEVIMQFKDQMSPELRKSMTKAAKDLDKTEKKAKAVNTQFKSMQATAVKAAAALGGLIVIRQVGVWLGQAAQEAASFEQGMRGLSAQMGLSVRDTRDYVGSLQDIVQGQVSLMDLTASTNRAVALLGKKAIPRFEELADVALRASKVMGISVTQAFDDVVTGIGRQSRMILDNLGIIVSVTDANEDYAMSLGKTVAQLTDAEKKQAFLNATLEQGTQKFKDIDIAEQGAAESLAITRAELADLKVEVGEKWLPVQLGWNDALSRTLGLLTDTNNELDRLGRQTDKDWAKRWADMLDEVEVRSYGAAAGINELARSMMTTGYVRGAIMGGGGGGTVGGGAAAGGIEPVPLSVIWGAQDRERLKELRASGFIGGGVGGGGRRTPTGTESDPIVIKFSRSTSTNPAFVQEMNRALGPLGISAIPWSSRDWGPYGPSKEGLYGMAGETGLEFGLEPRDPWDSRLPPILGFRRRRPTATEASRAAMDRAAGVGGGGGGGIDFLSLAMSAIGGGVSGGGAGALSAILPAIGTIIGGPVGGGIGSIISGLIGRKKPRGDTPAQPVFVRDVLLGDRLEELLNITKSQLTAGAAGGMQSIDMQLRAQMPRVGAT